MSLGKIQLNVPIARWLEQNTEGLGLLDLPLAVVVDATHLPGGFHKDPADRFIVASARHHQLTLVTGDSLILDDAQGGYERASRLTVAPGASRWTPDVATWELHSPPLRWRRHRA